MRCSSRRSSSGDMLRPVGAPAHGTASTGVRAFATELLLDRQERLGPERRLPLEGVQYDALEQIAKRDVEGGFYYRNPTSRAGVFSNDGGNTLLIGDLNTANAVTCPTIALRDAGGNLIPYTAVSAAVAALPAECFTFLSQFPGGFTPQFGGRMEDSALTLGVIEVAATGWAGRSSCHA